MAQPSEIKPDVMGGYYIKDLPNVCVPQKEDSRDIQILGGQVLINSRLFFYIACDSGVSVYHISAYASEKGPFGDDLARFLLRTPALMESEIGSFYRIWNQGTMVMVSNCAIVKNIDNPIDNLWVNVEFSNNGDNWFKYNCKVRGGFEGSEKSEYDVRIIDARFLLVLEKGKKMTVFYFPSDSREMVTAKKIGRVKTEYAGRLDELSAYSDYSIESLVVWMDVVSEIGGKTAHMRNLFKYGDMGIGNIPTEGAVSINSTSNSVSCEIFAAGSVGKKGESIIETSETLRGFVLRRMNLVTDNESILSWGTDYIYTKREREPGFQEIRIYQIKKESVHTLDEIRMDKAFDLIYSIIIEGTVTKFELSGNLALLIVAEKNNTSKKRKSISDPYMWIVRLKHNGRYHKGKTSKYFEKISLMLLAGWSKNEESPLFKLPRELVQEIALYCEEMTNIIQLAIPERS
jgi:hypothetical protein